MTRAWIVGVLAAGLVAALPAPAAAGVYTVHTCRAPTGAVAPIGDSETGWQAGLRPGTNFTTLADECARGGGIHAALSSSRGYALGAGATWTFRAPPDTAIQAFELQWRGVARDGGEVSLSRSDQVDPVYERRYGAPFGPETVAVRDVDLSHISTFVGCSFNQNGCPAGGVPAAELRIAAARLALADRNAPQVTGASGDLLASPTLRGTMGVTVSAQDRGGGLYRVVAEAGGATVAAPLSDPGGRCVDADPGNADPYEFTWPRPCQLQGQATAAVDTRGLPEGRHPVTVFLEDASGNRVAIHGPAEKAIDNDRGAINGANGGDGASLRLSGRRRRTTSFARRRIVLRGRLERGGAPVRGAVLDVVARNHRAGSRPRRIGVARTSARGRWRVRVRGGPSRTLSVAYRAFVDDAAPAAQVDVTQRVRGSVALRAARRRVGSFGTARFRGRVRGGFIPRRGKVVEIQAFDAGSWRTFETVRTDRRGRFRVRYRFRRTGGGRTFRFRARARFERGWPYILGVSRSVRVRVG